MPYFCLKNKIMKINSSMYEGTGIVFTPAKIASRISSLVLVARSISPESGLTARRTGGRGQESDP